MAPTVVGLIPARSGSRRIPGKNVRLLAGHPLVAYAISAALDSGVFTRVIVSTDSEEVAAVGRRYGAETPFLRPAESAGEMSPDIDWVNHTLRTLAARGGSYDAFSILRPTNPFRQAETIRRAWAQFAREPGADSLRAVELCRQHPAKMWVVEGEWMRPLLDDGGINPPWHSMPYQGLPAVYSQNASLEIAWSRVLLESGTIAGRKIIPFLTEGWEGFDINRPEDWLLAEVLIERRLAALPPVRSPVG